MPDIHEEVTPDAKYDLTQTLASYLDLHLMFPLCEFLEEHQMYDQHDLMHAKLDMLMPTNMVDFAKDFYISLNVETNDEELAEFNVRRERILETLDLLKEDAKPMLDLLDDPETQRLIDAGQFTIEYLEEYVGITREVVYALYKYAKFQYDCGNYGMSKDCLTYYGMLVKDDPEHRLQALWGRLAAEILMMTWDTGLKCLQELKDLIDTYNFPSPLIQLQQRTWMIHWALFIFYNHPDGKDAIIDFCFQQRNLEAIQANCPWILRYLTAAVIMNKRRRTMIKDLSRVIQQEANTYRDSMVEFFECLYINFDFETAHEKLRECRVLMASDFFLVFSQAEFMENARQLMFELYCRIHQKIDISMLSDELGMEEDHAERWIVDLIRNARLDAKIDSQENHVIMSSHKSNIYQQIIEKTKELGGRSYALAQGLDRLKTERYTSR